MSFKVFWENNKWSYLWSCLGLTFLVFFIGVFNNMIRTKAMGDLYVSTLVSFPLMLIMAFGIHEFTGGDKE